MGLSGGSFHPAGGGTLLFLCFFFLPLCLTSPFSVSLSLRCSYVSFFSASPFKESRPGLVSALRGVGAHRDLGGEPGSPWPSSPTAHRKHSFPDLSTILFKCHPTLVKVLVYHNRPTALLYITWGWCCLCRYYPSPSPAKKATSDRPRESEYYNRAMGFLKRRFC